MRVRRLWGLQFDTLLLLAIRLRLLRAGEIALVLTIVRVLRRLRRVRWRGLRVVWLRVLLVVVVVSGLAGAGGPACAVEGLATGVAAATRGEARAEDEEQEESKHDDNEDYPADPVVPGAVAAVPDAIIVPAVIIISGLQGWHDDDGYL